VESMQRDANRQRFHAPFAGVVGSVQVAQGDQCQRNAAAMDFYPGCRGHGVTGKLRRFTPRNHPGAWLKATPGRPDWETVPPPEHNAERIAAGRSAALKRCSHWTSGGGLRVAPTGISVPKPA